MEWNDGMMMGIQSSETLIKMYLFFNSKTQEKQNYKFFLFSGMFVWKSKEKNLATTAQWSLQEGKNSIESKRTFTTTEID